MCVVKLTHINDNIFLIMLSLHVQHLHTGWFVNQKPLTSNNGCDLGKCCTCEKCSVVGKCLFFNEKRRQKLLIQQKSFYASNLIRLNANSNYFVKYQFRV